MLIILGAITYYAAPKAFIYRDYGTFFLIINFLLLLMIIGLVFILTLLQPFLEKSLLYNLMNLLVRSDRNIYDVAVKNI